MIYLIDPQNPGIDGCPMKWITPPCPKDKVYPLYGIDPTPI
jgi:hypothetical protein